MVHGRALCKWKYYGKKMVIFFLFFMPKFRHKEVLGMFSDEILEKIFGKDEVIKVPIVYQWVMVRAIQEVLEEEKNNGTLQSV